MEIRIAFYNKRNTIYANGIYYVQMLQRTNRPDFTHVEIVIDGVWHTSSYNDGGVRERIISGTSGNWEYITLNIDEVNVKKMKDFFTSQRGKEYDVPGIFFSQLIPIGVDVNDRWFCSEIVSEALMISGVLDTDKDSAWYSPARLFDKLNSVE
jgi:hypothetical protein